MPTKPTQIWHWNTGGANRAAPPLGLQDAGYAEDEIPLSSHWNWMFFHEGNWQEWLSLGTYDPDEDAHVVETSATGLLSAARMVIPGLAAGTTAGLAATGAAGGGIGVQGQGVSAAAGVAGTGGVNGPGVTGTCGSSGAANMAGLVGTGVLTRPGVLGTGGATGIGVEGVGGATSGAGVQGTGTGTQPGVLGIGGPTAGYGVRGVPTSINSFGVSGETAAGATTSSAGVRGLATDDAAGGIFQAADGYGLIAISDVEDPVRAAFRIAPQGPDPTTHAEGDIIISSSVSQMRVRVDGQWQGVHVTPDGFCHAMNVAGGTTTNNDAGNYTTILTTTLQPPNEPKSAGVVVITAGGEFGNDGGTVHTEFQIRVRDTTDSVNVFERVIYMPGAVASVVGRSWSASWQYTLPDPGNRSFTLSFRKTGGAGTGVSAVDCWLEVRGIYG